MRRGGHHCDSPSHPGGVSGNSFLSHTLQKSGSRGLLRTPKDNSRSRRGAFPSGSELLSSFSSCRRDREDDKLGEWTRLELTKPSETSTPSRLLDFSCPKSHLITLTGDNSFNSLKIPRRTCNREAPMPELFLPMSLRILKSADSCF